MRLFAAVDPPEAARDHLERAIRRKGRDLRWVPPSLWHITLAFYGEVSPADSDELALRLDRAAGRTPPITVQLRGAGCFPRRPNAAKVLWTGIHGDLDGLGRLADRCVAAGRRTGVAMEKRNFAPHLTIARARQPSDVSGRLAELWDYDGPTWPADSLRLVHSTLGAQVRHETLAEWPLGH